MGAGEVFRGGVHSLMGHLACAFALYNAMRFTEERDRRHLVNVGVYAALWAFEQVQTARHWSRDA
jgi:predicted outer membrane lipoprotein